MSTLKNETIEEFNDRLPMVGEPRVTIEVAQDICAAVAATAAAGFDNDETLQSELEVLGYDATEVAETIASAREELRAVYA